MEATALVGDGDKGTDKDGSIDTVTGDDVQGGGSDSATLRERELGIDRGDVEGA